MPYADCLCGDPADWVAIWPFFLGHIVRAGETWYAYPLDIEQMHQARELWMSSPPFRTVVAVDDAGAAPDMKTDAARGPCRLHRPRRLHRRSSGGRSWGRGGRSGEDVVEWLKGRVTEESSSTPSSSPTPWPAEAVAGTRLRDSRDDGDPRFSRNVDYVALHVMYRRL